MKLRPLSSRRHVVLASLLALTLGAPRLQADDSTHGVRVTGWRVRPKMDWRAAGLGDTILVWVDSLNSLLRVAHGTGGIILFLDGAPVPGLHPLCADTSAGSLTFRLETTDSSRQTWAGLLGTPRLPLIRSLPLSVGTEGSYPAPSKITAFHLRVAHQRNLAFALALLLALLIALIWLARTTALLRDPGGPAMPYSLSRTQLAIWFYVVLASFIFIYVLTGRVAELPHYVLWVLGISAGTGFWATAVDSGKGIETEKKLNALKAERTNLEARIADLQQLAFSPTPPPDLNVLRAEMDVRQARRFGVIEEMGRLIAPPAPSKSEGLLSDLLTDASGLTLYRLQLLVWTLVLAALFCASVYTRLTMPEFNDSLLILAGISSGTYAGFRIPEKQ